MLLANLSVFTLLSLTVEIALLVSCLYYIKRIALKLSFAAVAMVATIWQTHFPYNAFNQGFQYIEMLRYSLFMLLLLYLLMDAKRSVLPRYWRVFSYATITLFAIAWAVDHAMPTLLPFSINVWLYCKIMACLLLIIFSEQLLRHSDTCRVAKFSVLIIMTQVSYDLFIHCNLLLRISDSDTLWQARAFISTSASLLLALAIMVIPFEQHQQNKFELSNPVILFNSSVLLAGAFLILISTLSTVVAHSSLAWGELFTIFFYVFALLSITTLACMKKFRRTLNVYISKHFFNHQYDYHKHWIALDLLLSPSATQENSDEIALRAIITLFDCRSGALWLKGPQFFSLSSSQGIHLPSASSIEDINSSFITKMTRDEWVFQSPKHANEQEKQVSELLPPWFTAQQSSWTIVPLQYQKTLIGFIFLCKEQVTQPLTWEDLDILKLTGRQIASYLQQQQNAQQILENKKFDLFNQVTAFAIHDIKNLVAQQSLLLKNADKFRNSPEFIDDMIFTLANSVQKMDKVLIKLRGDNNDKLEKVDVAALVQHALTMNQQSQPTPTFTVSASSTMVHSDPEKLQMAINHLLKNAFDATEASGCIQISLINKAKKLWLEIADSGCGMSQDFIKNELFKPFNSTKKEQGMGLGAYQIKALIHAIRGELFVESQPNHGTTFFICLPVSNI